MRKTVFFGVLLANAVVATAQNDSIARLMRHVEEVTVTGTRGLTDVRHVPMTVNIIGREQIETRHNQNVLTSLGETVPGVYVTARGVMGYGVSTGGTGGITIRGVGGSPTTGVLMLIDGHPQFQGVMGHAIADASLAVGAERVEVLRGPSSVLYGSNAMGGVVNIVTRKPTDDGVETDLSVGGGSYGSFTADVTNRVKAGRFGSVVGGSYQKTDGHRDNMEFKQGGGYGKLTFDVSDAWRAFADVSITKFDASNPGTEDNPYIDNDQWIMRGAASGGVGHTYSNINGMLTVYGNWGHHKIDDGYHEGEKAKTYYFKSDDYVRGVSVYETMSLFTGNRLTVGADIMRSGGRAWNEAKADGAETVLVSKHETEFGIYAEERQDIAEYITIDAGIRYDKHSTAGKEILPQVGLTWHVNGHTDFKLIASKGFRNPTIKELYMFKSRNAELTAEKMMNYEVAFSQFLVHRRLKWGVNLYMTDADNMISTVVKDGNPLNVNIGESRNKGMEIEASFRLTPHATIGMNYSYLDMEKPILATPEHKLNVHGSMRQGNFTARTNIEYVGGLYTNVTAGKEKTEDYVVWDAGVEYSFIPELVGYLRADNILATKYETVEGMPMPKATVMVGINVKLGR